MRRPMPETERPVVCVGGVDAWGSVMSELVETHEFVKRATEGMMDRLEGLPAERHDHPPGCAALSAICPYPDCGCVQELLEWEDMRVGESREVCARCRRPFAQRASCRFFFVTRQVDEAAEQAETLAKQAQEAFALRERYRSCLAFAPGTRVRVRLDSGYAPHLRGRVGIVGVREVSATEPYVDVVLDAAGDEQQVSTFFRPMFLESES